MSFKVIFISGPTASGKTEVALEVAHKYKGAIINCDSIQVYKELSVGAAKPTAEEFAKVPHFLFDLVSYPHEYTAGDYTRDFHAVIEKIKTEFPFVLVVGGTGFYFQAVEKGMFDAGKADAEIMKQLKAELATREGAEKLYQELLSVDPESAKTIHSNDHYRLQRALGIWRTEGKSVSELRKQKSTAIFPYPLEKFGIAADKKVLEEKIQKRAECMLEHGLIGEVEELLNKGYRHWPPLQSVGYRETVDFLDGRIRTKFQLKEHIIISTRQLAKKQRTWFQRDSAINWVDLNSAFARISERLF
jgi:tRNA dimethylallyltransferase